MHIRKSVIDGPHIMEKWKTENSTNLFSFEKLELKWFVLTVLNKWSFLYSIQ